MAWERIEWWSGEGGISFGLGYERRMISRVGMPSADGDGIWRIGELVKNAEMMLGSEMKTRSRKAI